MKAQPVLVYLPDTPAAQTFYKRLSPLGVAPAERFSLRTASRCGLSRKRFLEIQDVFLANKWVRGENASNPRQGLFLTTAGAQVVEHLVLTAPDPA